MPKKFVGQPFSVILTSGIEKFCASEGYVTILRRKFFCPTVPKLFERNPSVLCSRKFLLTKKFMDERVWGVSRFFVENFLSHSADKFLRASF